MKTFEYHSPETLEQAISLLVHYNGQARLLAGGTDLIVEMRNGTVSPKAVIDIKGIPDLQFLKDEKESMRIGALVTIRDIETSPLIEEKFPILKETARVMASFQVRNRATLVGNICHASPAADMVPSLIGLGSKIKIVGKNSEKVMELEDFFAGPGKTKLEQGEILREVIVPKPDSNCKGAYIKLSPRKLTDLAVVGVALIYWEDRGGRCEDVRIVMGAVGPKAIRAKEAEKSLVGKKLDELLLQEAAEKAMMETSPITDVRGSDWYRKAMVKVLVERGLRKLCRF
jgi:CO/xanthine dehydrogenase FAD-binding subunit